MASKQRKRKTKQPARFDGFVPVDNALLDTILESSKGDNDGESDDGSLINWSGSSGSESSEEDLSEVEDEVSECADESTISESGDRSRSTSVRDQLGTEWIGLDLGRREEEVRRATTEFVFDQEGDVGVTEDKFGKLPNELEIFLILLNPDLVDMLLENINAFATVKIQKNTPPTKRSRFGHMDPMTEMELYKFIAVVIAMGMDKRPFLRDYWSDFAPFQTPWYKGMFQRERFEVG